MKRQGPKKMILLEVHVLFWWFWIYLTGLAFKKHHIYGIGFEGLGCYCFLWFAHSFERPNKKYGFNLCIKKTFNLRGASILL